MGRREYDYKVVTGVGGINQTAELANSQTQLADALNLWAPAGRVEQRPGVMGVGCLDYLEAYNNGDVTGTVIVKETPIGTFTTTADLSSLGVGKRWYLGFDGFINALYTNIRITGLGWAAQGGTGGNTNAIAAAVEFWNGQEWFPCAWSDTTSTNYHLQGDGFSRLVWPDSLAQTVVNGLTKYWFRFTLISLGDVAFDASVETSFSQAFAVSLAKVLDEDVSTKSAPQVVFPAQYPSEKRYLSVYYRPGLIEAPTLFSRNRLDGFVATTETSTITITHALKDFEEPPTFAIVPQFDDAYYALSNTVIRFFRQPNSNSKIGEEATVETDASIVGSGALYDATTVPQLASWPRSKYITFFRGKLWAANIEGEPYTVRWSAPVPYYKVWPTIQAEFVMEDDNSPISGLHGYGQHMTVFKSDSIWRFVEGQVINGLETMEYDRVVDGIGCVSNSSIQEIQGRLIFLAEDGLYAYNGTPDCQKISLDKDSGADRIKDFIASITPGRRQFATATHWKTKSCYLLACSVGGSRSNNRVLVWDYKNDSFWVWDLPAQSWISTEDALDNEKLYYVDQFDSVFEIGPGNTDYGAAISSYGVTHRLGYDGWRRRIRNVELVSTNNSSSVTVEVIPNDDASGTSGTLSLSDPAEKTWSSFTFGTDSYAPERRDTPRLSFRSDVDWAQVKFSHSTYNTPFKMSNLRVGFVELGPR